MHMHMHDTTEVRQPPDYRGINHSRMTASHADALRDMPRAFMALEKLRRVVGDGNTITLYGGVRGWATFLECASGYPKRILDRLADEGFVEVVYLDDGFADVTVLPPPELQHRPPPNETDQPLIAPISAISERGATPELQQSLQSAQSVRSSVRSIDDPMSHESCSMQQQQQHCSPIENKSHKHRNVQRPDPNDQTPISPPTTAKPAPCSPTARPPDLAFPAAWAAIRQANPTYTAGDFARDMAAAQARADVKNPVGLVVTCARRGEPVYTRADLDERAPRPAPRPQTNAAPPDQRRGQRRARRDDAVPNVTYTAEEEARCRDDYARAQALVAALAPDADELQVAYVMLDLQNGVDEETAQANARVRVAGGAV